MTISTEYEDLLHHFRRTKPVIEFADNLTQPGIALRHDVDHDIDVALEMARFEYDRGFRASYYILPGAPYWDDKDLAEKLLQLRDYGHEIGLHTNIISDWLRRGANDPRRAVEESLARLRGGGVNVVGMAAHGDQLCYEKGFINYWAFRELRPADPTISEDKRTAEGPFAGAEDKLVRYHGDDIVRDDGERFMLWSISMESLGLQYDAWHVPADSYFSDSGGRWRGAHDPLSHDLNMGRNQVLIHPIHWLGQPRTYFFLSAARSGSKWLANFLDAATPLTVRHEFMLNHAFHAKESGEKRTGNGFRDLALDVEEAGRLIAEGWTIRETINRDYAEVNVYPEAFVDELVRYFPDAMYIHLQRDPRAVVRSLIGRGWYDTPDDPRHRSVDVEGWDSFDQFTRVCYYVADVMARLERVSQTTIRLETATTDLAALTKVVEDIGIVVHPRLAARAHGEIIDATRKHEYASYSGWLPGDRAAYKNICGKVERRAGYGSRFSSIRESLQRLLARSAKADTSNGPAGKGRILLAENARLEPTLWHLSGFTLTTDTGVVPHLVPNLDEGERHRHCILGGSEWSLAATDKTAWEIQPNTYLAGRISVRCADDGRLTLFVLSYDDNGEFIHKRQLGVFDQKRQEIAFSCRFRADAARFDIALYAAKTSVPSWVAVDGVELSLKPLPHAYEMVRYEGV